MIVSPLPPRVPPPAPLDAPRTFRCFARWHGSWLLGKSEETAREAVVSVLPRIPALLAAQPIAPLVHAVLEETDAARRWPCEWREHLEQAYYQQAARNTMLLARYSRISAVLRSSGIPHMPLKGVDMIRNVYRNMALRGMMDIDILVRPAQAVEAARIVCALGYSPLRTGGMPAVPTPSPYLNSRYLVPEDGGVPVHLHWHLLNTSVPRLRPLEAIDMERVWSRSSSCAGPLSRTLHPMDRFLHLCDHALKHSFCSLAQWVDLGLLVQGGGQARPGVGVRLESAVEEARATGRETGVAFALRYLADVMGLPIPAEVRHPLRRVPQGPLERYFDRRVCAGTSREGLCVLVYLAEEPNWRSRLRFLWRSLAPPPDALAAIDLPPSGRTIGWRDYGARLGSAFRLAARLAREEAGDR